MEEQIHNTDFFDRAMHDSDNNFHNVFLERDPDLQILMNSPIGQIIHGDELLHHSNLLGQKCTRMSWNIATLRDHFLSLQTKKADYFAPSMLALYETKSTHDYRTIIINRVSIYIQLTT